MVTAILDQNGIKDLCINSGIDGYIVSPMFFWELFNNIESSLGQRLKRSLQQIADRIKVTYKSITCERIELESKSHKKLEDFINQNNTKFIRDWLLNNDGQLSDIRVSLSSGFTKEDFNEKFIYLADDSWIPKLKSQFNNYESPKARQNFRESFENVDYSATNEIFKKTLSVCFQLLKDMDFSTEQSVLFVKQPSVFYNRVFCHTALFMYRSTQSSFKKKTVPNDSKDIDYLFCSHLVDQIVGGDIFMKTVFSHLKKSYQILADTKTGL